MWASLPPELVARIAFFAPRDGSALRWCCACHWFRAAQPRVHVLMLGDFASIVSNPLMQSSISSVDVLNELVVNLPATSADAAYECLELLPSRVLDDFARLFIAAPLHPGHLAFRAFKPMPRLKALHIQHPDVGAEDASDLLVHESTCNACLETVQALVSAGQPRDCLSVDIVVGSEAENCAEQGVMRWDADDGPFASPGSGQWVEYDPAQDLAKLIGRIGVQTLALNLGCHKPVSFRPRMQAVLDRWCHELLEPPILETYERRRQLAATTIGFDEFDAAH